MFAGFDFLSLSFLSRIRFTNRGRPPTSHIHPYNLQTTQSNLVIEVFQEVTITMYSSQTLDKPGMIEAKIMLPNSTSTPLKPFRMEKCMEDLKPFCSNRSPMRKAEDSSTCFNSAFDSGYSSVLQELEETKYSNRSNHLIYHDTVDSKATANKPSLFESILKSRNHSISLEQLVEKVNLKKEAKIGRDGIDFQPHGRLRSYSASDATVNTNRGKSLQYPYKFSTSSLSLYSDMSLSIGGGSKWSVSGSDSQSPTMDQVLLMGRDRKNCRIERSYSDGGDYDLSELVANLRFSGPPPPTPLTPSPDASTYRRTPESLFGLETFQSFSSRQDPCRPKLECITENDQDLCATPEEYYTTGNNFFKTNIIN